MPLDSYKNQILHPFEDLSIWKHFKAISVNKAEVLNMVTKHVNYVIPLIEQYTYTFPKYTLHNIRHQQNVLKMMGELLGDEVNELSILECIILILSAIYHDIGMVYTKSEIEDIIKEERFQVFLDQNIKARLMFEEAKRTATSSLIEWYCRWAHAERVWLFLAKDRQTIPLTYEGIPIKDELGIICESHNKPVDSLKNETFYTDFLGDCDMKFCAILLRLADILDFDNSRAPMSLYKHLSIGNPQNQSDISSQEEWIKHMHSQGFFFKKNDNQKELLFKAAPTHPGIEVKIRHFIKVIEKELKGCNKLLRFCSPRWSNFQLPKIVNTENIKSDNYISGNYHFSLSEDKIIDLLTGDDLYDDELVFLRELIQNAIDTSRHREFIERKNKPSFQADPIEVTFFSDSEGYYWIRVDDYGMGMNKEIIFNHLLKKGESYYNSDLFKIDKLFLNGADGSDFVPISRFGIGLLSCFIVGDKIEINSKYFNRQYLYDNEAYRLSVEGKDGYFFLQSSQLNHNPSVMPSKFEEKIGFRNKWGTSVAVRMKTNKEFVQLDIEKVLQDYIICSPIPVIYKGKLMGGDFNDILSIPWANRISIPLDRNVVEEVEQLTNLNLPQGISIEIIPLDITQASRDKNLKGQIVFLTIFVPDLLNIHTDGVKFKISQYENVFIVSCNRTIRENGMEKVEVVECNVPKDKMNLSIPFHINSFYSSIRHLEELRFGSLILSHNGIKLHDKKNLFDFDEDSFSHFFNGSYSYTSILTSGILYFQDYLLPDLTISRNEIKRVNFSIVSNLLFSLKYLNQFTSNPYSFFKRLYRNIDLTTRIIKNSLFYESNKKYWDNELILNSVDFGLISVIKAKLMESFNLKNLRGSYSDTFYRYLINYIIQENFVLSIDIKKPDNKYSNNILIEGKERNLDLSSVILEFDPSLFVAFNNFQEKLVYGQYINQNHPLMIWFFEWFNLLSDNYFYYSRQIIYILLGESESTVAKVDQINQILLRLRVLLPKEAKPNETLDINENDLTILFQ